MTDLHDPLNRPTLRQQIDALWGDTIPWVESKVRLCPKGLHEMTADNTGIKMKRGYPLRYCFICYRADRRDTKRRRA